MDGCILGTRFIEDVDHDKSPNQEEIEELFCLFVLLQFSPDRWQRHDQHDNQRQEDIAQQLLVEEDFALGGARKAGRVELQNTGVEYC